MRDRERNKLDKYEREAAFMAANAGDYAPGSRGATITAQFAAEIANAKALAAGQTGGADERAQHIEVKGDALDELKRLMKRLDRAGDILEDDFPGIENLFGLPLNRSEASVLAAARAQYTASADYEAALIECDLPADFRVRMNNLIDEIDAANRAADTSGGQSVGSTGALKASIEKLGKLSRHLDRINRNKHEADPQKLGAWLTASHLQKAPKPAKNGGADGVHNP